MINDRPEQILVVEDDNGVRTLLINTLTEATGYKVTSTNKAEKALDLLKDRSFDLIVLDLELFGMTGNDFLSILTRKGITIPVIIVSANASKALRYPQVRHIIQKPFEIDLFLDNVEKVLAR